jgi:hypothetical protein
LSEINSVNLNVNSLVDLPIKEKTLDLSLPKEVIKDILGNDSIDFKKETENKKNVFSTPNFKKENKSEFIRLSEYSSSQVVTELVSPNGSDKALLRIKASQSDLINNNGKNELKIDSPYLKQEVKDYAKEQSKELFNSYVDVVGKNVAYGSLGLVAAATVAGVVASSATVAGVVASSDKFSRDDTKIEIPDGNLLPDGAKIKAIVAYGGGEKPSFSGFEAKYGTDVFMSDLGVTGKVSTVIGVRKDLITNQSKPEIGLEFRGNPIGDKETHISFNIKRSKNDQDKLETSAGLFVYRQF